MSATEDCDAPLGGPVLVSVAVVADRHHARGGGTGALGVLLVALGVIPGHLVGAFSRHSHRAVGDHGGAGDGGPDVETAGLLAGVVEHADGVATGEDHTLGGGDDPVTRRVDRDGVGTAIGDLAEGAHRQLAVTEDGHGVGARGVLPESDTGEVSDGIAPGHLADSVAAGSGRGGFGGRGDADDGLTVPVVGISAAAGEGEGGRESDHRGTDGLVGQALHPSHATTPHAGNLSTHDPDSSLRL